MIFLWRHNDIKMGSKYLGTTSHMNVNTSKRLCANFYTLFTKWTVGPLNSSIEIGSSDLILKSFTAPLLGDLMKRSIWSSAIPFPANLDQTKPWLISFHNVSWVPYYQKLICDFPNIWNGVLYEISQRLIDRGLVLQRFLSWMMWGFNKRIWIQWIYYTHLVIYYFRCGYLVTCICWENK